MMNQKSQNNKKTSGSDKPSVQQMAKLIYKLAYRHSPYRVFSNFVEMSAIAMSNATDKRQYEAREKRYLEIVSHYSKDELSEFPRLLSMLTLILEEAPQDALGELYHQLEIHNEQKGQFFTPFPICRMMAQMTISDQHHAIMDNQGFITLSEPACGTGAMVIAAAMEIGTRGYSYQKNLHVHAVDIDVKCVHAAFVQFSLLHIPAVVIHGNTLTMEEFSHWYTPAHIIGGWNYRLNKRPSSQSAELLSDKDTDVNNSPTQSENSSPDISLHPSGFQLKLF